MPVRPTPGQSLYSAPSKLAVPQLHSATPMPSPIQPTVLYLVAPGPAARAVRAALMAMNVLPREATGDAAGLLGLQGQLSANPEWLAIIDMQALLPRAVGCPLALATLLSDTAVRARVLLARGNSGPVWQADRAWVRSLGFYDLVADLDSAALLGDAAVLLEPWQTIVALATGVASTDRVRTYPACFIGSEAVDTLQVAFQLPRHACEMVLKRLHGYGLIEHVTQEHPVHDGNFSYRFTYFMRAPAA